MTREKFVSTYRDFLVATYPWARDLARLEKFMASVEVTLATSANTWNIDSECVRAAWRAIGGKGRPTYRALKALPSVNPLNGAEDDDGDAVGEMMGRNV